MGIIVGDGVVEWVAPRALGASTFGTARAIGWESNGKIVAGVVYTNWNGRNIDVHVAIDGPITRKFIWTICDYPFNQLKVERVTGMVAENNRKSRNFAERIGFVKETTLRNAHPSGDLLVYVIRKKECRWLQSRQRLALAA